ncbi:hypothetical protein [Microcoleus sp. T3_D1]
MVFFPKYDATFSVGIYEDWSKCDRPYFPKARYTLFSQITQSAIALPLQI